MYIYNVGLSGVWGEGGHMGGEAGKYKGNYGASVPFLAVDLFFQEPPGPLGLPWAPWALGFVFPRGQSLGLRLACRAWCQDSGQGWGPLD